MVLSPSRQAQSSAPLISLATLRQVLASGQAAQPALACWMDHAAHVIALRHIERATGAGWWVESESSDRQYWVLLDARGYRGDLCTCREPDRSGPCQHSMAVRLLLACE